MSSWSPKVSFNKNIFMEQEKDIYSPSHFRDYWFIILNRKKVIIISTILLTLTGFLGVGRQTPYYTAKVKITVKIGQPIYMSRNPSIGGLDRDYTLYQSGVYDSEYELMRSSIVLRKAAEMLGWKGKDGLDDLSRAIRIDPIRISYGSTNTAFIIATSTDPKKAKDMANFTAKAYIESKEEEAREKIKKAYDIFSEQLQIVKKKLGDSETAFDEFKKNHGIMGFEDVNIDETSARQLETDLIDTTAKIDKLDVFLRSSENLESEESIFAAINLITRDYPEAINEELIKEKATKENDLVNLLGVYTEKHPLVIQKRAQIDELNNHLKKGFKNNIANLKTIYDMLKAKEKNIMYSLKPELIKPELGKAKGEYHTIKQEVESNKDIYNNLVSSMKELNVYEEMSGMGDARVLEWAKLPASPEQTQNVMLVFAPFIGLFLGISMAFFFEYMNNTIKTDADIKQHLNLPVIGIISHIEEKDR